MTTLVVVENNLGSCDVVCVVEDFGGETSARDLRPGDSARLVVSRFKTLTLRARRSLESQAGRS